MTPWLDTALDYLPRWIGYQMAAVEQPGCVIAVAHKGRLVFEQAFGVANLATGEPLTPRHRFRVASHSKTFTAAGVMKLRERGEIGLDDPAGRYVAGLHPDVARATVGQLLSHSAGITRDGADGGAFMDRRPFLSLAELKAELARPQPLAASETFKYSNHGIALVGHIIEAIAGEAYGPWISREIIAPLGLTETAPDITLVPVARPPIAAGHTTKLPYGRRLVVPGLASGNAMTSAAGFVSTAADLVRFFSALSPTAETSMLSVASRREMSRRQMRDRHSGLERYYGLGTIIGPPGAWTWWGHSGGWQGTLTRTAVVPDHDLAVSVLTNAVDGPAQTWMDGILHIFRTIHSHSHSHDASAAARADWSGRWWNLWTAVDLVPVGAGKVLVAVPAQALPFFDATVLEIDAPDTGRVAQAQAFGDLGESVRRERDGRGAVAAVWIGGKKLLGEAAFKAEIEGRYGATAPA